MPLEILLCAQGHCYNETGLGFLVTEGNSKAYFTYTFYTIVRIQLCGNSLRGVVMVNCPQTFDHIMYNDSIVLIFNLFKMVNEQKYLQFLIYGSCSKIVLHCHFIIMILKMAIQNRSIPETK